MCTILFLFSFCRGIPLTEYNSQTLKHSFYSPMFCFVKFFLLLPLHFFEINFCSPWFTTNSRPIIPPRATYTTHCGLCIWSTALAIDRTFTHTAECKFSAAGLVQIDLCIDLIKVPNSAIVALPGAFTT